MHVLIKGENLINANTVTKHSCYTKHYNAITGEKPYSCMQCKKSFATSGGLRVHIRTHTGEKPYKCQYCHKAYSDYSTMKHHLGSHTKLKPY